MAYFATPHSDNLGVCPLDRQPYHRFKNEAVGHKATDGSWHIRGKMSGPTFWQEVQRRGYNSQEAVERALGTLPLADLVRGGETYEELLWKLPALLPDSRKK